MTINQRFQLIIDTQYSGNKRSFAVASQISPTVIENVVGRRQGKPSFDVLQKVCANANINERWLLTGEGDMLKNVSTPSTPAKAAPAIYNEEDNNRKAAKNIPGAIPLVSQRAVGGFAGESFSIMEEDIKAYYVIPKFNSLNVDFMIELTGDSMIPRLWPGDIVACSIIRQSSFIQWNKPHLLATREQGLIVKRIRKSQDSSCLLAVSDNKDYDDFDIPKEEILGIARVVGVIHLE